MWAPNFVATGKKNKRKIFRGMDRASAVFQQIYQITGHLYLNQRKRNSLYEQIFLEDQEIRINEKVGQNQKFESRTQIF